MDPLFEIPLSRADLKSGNLVSHFSGQIKKAIVQGKLARGLRLPSTRTLSQTLAISRNTAISVYEALKSEGYIESRPGGGTFVRNLPVKPERNSNINAGYKRLNSYWYKQSQQPLFYQPERRYDFRLVMPELRYFPFEDWRRLLAKASRQQALKQSFDADPQGALSLRDAIAQHLSIARALPCVASDVVVTAGAQQAMDLIARILVTPGKTVVAVESPGYPMARFAFEAAGAIVQPVTVDDEGIKVNEIPANADLVYVTPSHQFPLGMAMSAQRRLALLRMAQEQGMSIIEDDYDSEFRIAELPIEAMKVHDKNQDVFYVGTFSKCLLPDLRCGFVLVPQWAKDPLVRAKFQTDWHCAALQQEALADFIQQGYLEKHLRKMRRIYRARYQSLFAACQQLSGSLLDPIAINTGVHMSAHLTAEVDASKVAANLREQDVSLGCWKDFSDGCNQLNGLIFGFGCIEEHAIQPGMQRVIEEIERILK